MQVGHVIDDMTGANPVACEALANSGAARLDDMTWSSDHHYLSAAPGSIVFSNATISPTRVSYFTTQTTAALYALTFDTGFTE